MGARGWEIQRGRREKERERELDPSKRVGVTDKGSEKGETVTWLEREMESEEERRWKE